MKSRQFIAVCDTVNSENWLDGYWNKFLVTTEVHCENSIVYYIMSETLLSILEIFMLLTSVVMESNLTDMKGEKRYKLWLHYITNVDKHYWSRIQSVVQALQWIQNKRFMGTNLLWLWFCFLRKEVTFANLFYSWKLKPVTEIHIRKQNLLITIGQLYSEFYVRVLYFNYFADGKRKIFEEKK